jgi:hypothetical protein
MADEPSLKKMCLEKGKKGKKNLDLARSFETYGVPLRVRCKLCYHEWLENGVQHLVQDGMCMFACWGNPWKKLCVSGVPETEAMKQMQLKTPSETDVPTYARSGTESLKRHLVVKHGAVETDKAGDVPAINTVFPKAATVEDKVALVFCMNPNVPLSLVEDAFFKQAFGHPFNRCKTCFICQFIIDFPSNFLRQKLPRVIGDLAHRLEERVASKVVSVAAV